MDFYGGALVSGVCKMEKGCSLTVVVCGVLLFLHFTTTVGHFCGVSASSTGMLQYNMAALLALRSSPAVARPATLNLSPLMLPDPLP